jgi:hypothetical protein
MLQRTIALIADCDDTLARDTTGQLLQHFGVDKVQFYRERVAPLVNDGWDPPLAYLHEILQLAREGRLDHLTKTTLEEIGRDLELYPGVPEFFSQLRAEVEQHEAYKEHGIKVQFYVITGGIEDLVAASPIGDAVDDIWGCNFAYDDDGRVVFPRCVVSFTEKTASCSTSRKVLWGISTRTYHTSSTYQWTRRIDLYHSTIWCIWGTALVIFRACLS